MFQSYLFPISYAFMTFPVAALFFTLPFLIVQYRKHGYINKIRAVVLYLLLLYLLNAFYLIMLPMPASRHNLPPSGNTIQHIPLQFIQEILKEGNFSVQQPSSYLALLREPAFLQTVFNIVLTIPFGLFLGYYFRTRWVVCILLSFSLSLLFEITQITGIYGIFDYPYRIFDVDDLITNTLGGMIGFRIALWISGLLPKIEQLDNHEDLAAKRVTFTRRSIAFMLDAFVWLAGLSLLNSLSVSGAFWISTSVFCLLVPCLAGGRTLGKWIVRIRISTQRERLRLWMLITRYLLLYGLLIGMNRLILVSSQLDGLTPALATVVRIAVFLGDMAFSIHLFIGIFKKKRVLFYENISQTCNVITWPEKTLESAKDVTNSVVN
ncbi:VanZ family protein [Paenibacillus sp. FSL H7-0357]|uniref:VanZ family protein n=1 Tax=Paenibacillus sp. FSL H7-0357 TaxID=1536774 RepID=UPI00068EB4C5|nr:VanZ family protein [Paenibacillus sp. FSL H7-0357]